MGFETIKNNVRGLDLPDDEIEEIIDNLDEVFLSVTDNLPDSSFIEAYENASAIGTAFRWASTRQGRVYWATLADRYHI